MNPAVAVNATSPLRRCFDSLSMSDTAVAAENGDAEEEDAAAVGEDGTDARVAVERGDRNVTCRKFAVLSHGDGRLDGFGAGRECVLRRARGLEHRTNVCMSKMKWVGDEERSAATRFRSLISWGRRPGVEFAGVRREVLSDWRSCL